MHIVLGILGAIVTILILVKRLNDAGFDPSSLNPFLWYRRHKWSQQYHTRPIFNLQEPMEASALMLVATAKCEGDISAEEKQTILTIFENDFHRSQREAAGLFTSSTFLLKDEQDIEKNLAKILAPSKERFTAEQAESIVALMHKVAEVGGAPRELQGELIQKVGAILLPPTT